MPFVSSRGRRRAPVAEPGSSWRSAVVRVECSAMARLLLAALILASLYWASSASECYAKRRSDAWHCLWKVFDQCSDYLRDRNFTLKLKYDFTGGYQYTFYGFATIVNASDVKMEKVVSVDPPILHPDISDNLVSVRYRFGFGEQTKVKYIVYMTVCPKKCTHGGKGQTFVMEPSTKPLTFEKTSRWQVIGLQDNRTIKKLPDRDGYQEVDHTRPVRKYDLSKPLDRMFKKAYGYVGDQKSLISIQVNEMYNTWLEECVLKKFQNAVNTLRSPVW